MDEMEKLIDEVTGVTEVVEVATDKLTFKENIMAYSLAGIFVTGLVTVGYLGYKGTKKLANKIRDKRESKVVTEEAVDEVINEYDEFENKKDESEE
jgi:hypothetical protein